MLPYLPLVLPFGLLMVVGGINVTESARAAGDDYRTRDILLVEAVATLVAGVCGGVAQTTPYIGQPAYKRMGARSGYTLLTGLFIGLGGMLGLVSGLVELLPLAVLAPIIVFVAIDICVQAFQASPPKHAPAVVLAFFPPVAYLLAIKLGNPGIVPPERFAELFTAPSWIAVMLGQNIWPDMHDPIADTLDEAQTYYRDVMHSRDYFVHHVGNQDWLPIIGATKLDSRQVKQVIHDVRQPI